jgi:hypothetical protein
MPRIRGLLALLLATAGTGWALAARADEVNLTDLVETLREEGVIDDAQYMQMQHKAEARENKKKWTDRISFFGDLRNRWESFVYQDDAEGHTQHGQNRARYRLRVGANVDINDYADAVFRISSGQDDSRSFNVSYGDRPDFAPDFIFIDEAYMVLTPFANGRLGNENGYWGFEVGKVPNPFVSGDRGPDYLLWDNDITLEGAGTKLRWQPFEKLDVYLNGGYYVDQEASGAKDPGVVGAQIGGAWRLSNTLEVGARTGYFGFVDLNQQFFLRGIDSSAASKASTKAGGNLPGGLSDDDSVHVLGGRVYVRSTRFADWPILLYGEIDSNLSAGSIPGSHGSQDLAWQTGIEVGNKAKFAQLGMLYAWEEANSFPAQFVDSDMFDGYTNRKGFGWYVVRQLLENTDMKLELFWDHEIEDSLPVFAVSVPNARRLRLRADLMVKF